VKKLCALLYTKDVLRDHLLKSKNLNLTKSLEIDLDVVNDLIFEEYRAFCKSEKLSDYDMSLINFLKTENIELENMDLLGWEP
jgi:hypothetical protein